jgi:hypothetical protein
MSFIEVMITDLCNLSLESGFAESLNKTLADYNSTTNTTIINLMKDSVFAVGAALLTLFMLMELVAMVNRSGGGEGGLGSIKLPANVMLKFAIFAFLFCHIPAVLKGIEATAVSIGSSMISTANFKFGVGVDISQIAEISNAIENLGFFNKIFTYIVVFVCWLFVHFVAGIVSLTTVFRAFELWLLLLFSPIPLATLASQEFKQTAINFLKTFTAVCLQGSAIIACFLIYQALMGSFVKSYSAGMDISEFINSFLLQNIIYSAVLAVSVFSSGKIVKQIMNAV